MIERERGSIKFEIIEHFGVLSTAPTGWTKELNLVKWNDRAEKYDIRDWAPGHERMSRGITLFDYEMKKIVELCSDFFVEDATDAPAECEVSAVTAQPAAAEPVADKVAEEEIPF